MTCYVDIPNCYDFGLDTEWVSLATFKTRDEAVEFVKNNFGGIDGKLDLVTECEDDSEPE